jgi:hypothetical protein
MYVIRTHLANHIKASSRGEWLHQQARHMTASDRIVITPTQHLTPGRRPHMTLFGHHPEAPIAMQQSAHLCVPELVG